MTKDGEVTIQYIYNRLCSTEKKKNTLIHNDSTHILSYTHYILCS